MGFDKSQKKEESLDERYQKFELDNSNDRRVIKEFEKEVAPYFDREETWFGKKISGFDLFLHEKNLVRYSQRYPHGAVVFNNLSEYNLVKLKIAALRELWRRRRLAQKHQAEAVNSMQRS